MAYPVFMVPAGDVLPIFFDSYSGTTGASVTLTGLLASDVEIYKDGSVTQRASDAGYTLLDTDGIDFDGITGIHGFSIDTGDNTDAGFYTVGAWFTVVVSAVTIDSQTVSFVAAQFRLMAAESVAAKPKVDVDAWLGTAAATPTVAGVPEVDLTHVAGATTNVAALATNVDAILTDTAVIGATGGGLTSLATQASVNTIDDFLDTEIAAIITTLGTPAGASISADIAAIEAQTDDIGVAGAGLTAVPWNAAWDAEVQSEVDDALVVHRLDELLNADSDIDGAAPPTVGSVFHELMSKTAGSFTYDQTTDSNEALRDNLATASALATAQTSIDDLPTNAELATSQGTADDATLAAIAALTIPSAATIADAVWDEAIAGHAAAGSTGEALSSAGSAGDPWGTALPGAYGAGTAGKIIGDNINATVSSRASQTSLDTVDDLLDTEIAALTTAVADIPTNAELATALGTADDATLAAIAALSIPTAAAVADAVWDEDATAHQTQGTFGQAIGDPAADTNTIFKAVVTDATGATVGVDVVAVKAETAAILDDTDDIGIAGAGLTALATQASVTTIDDLLDTEIAALTTAVADIPTNAELATALGTADDATLAAIAALSIPTAAQNADALLDRNIAGGSNGGRDVTSALRAIRNKVSISAGTLTVTEEDDTTSAWTAAVTTTAGNPISAVDPA